MGENAVDMAYRTLPTLELCGFKITNEIIYQLFIFIIEMRKFNIYKTKILSFNLLI